MITIQIPKKELLRQLPQKAGYALMQWMDEMPEFFIFQGAEVRLHEEALMDKYPQLLGKLTPGEWQLLTSLFQRGKVSYSHLMYELKLEDEDGFLPTSNVLNVHVKNLRNKIRQYKLPFRVVTFEQNAYRQGSYKLIELL